MSLAPPPYSVSEQTAPPPLYSVSQPKEQIVDVDAKWDEKHKSSPVDVDLAVSVHTSTGQLLDLACFNQIRIAGGAVTHSGDRRDGSKKGVDEKAKIYFHLLPPAVQIVLVVVTIASKGSSLDSFANFSLSISPLDKSKNFLATKQREARSFVPFAFIRGASDFQFLDIAHWSAKQGLENVWSMCDEVLVKLVDPNLWKERPSIKYDQLNLKKGQDIVLDQKLLDHSITVGAGWDVGDGKGFDVDLWCIAMRRSTQDHSHYKMAEEIYFNHLNSDDGSIIHSGDNRTGKGTGDDEKITVKLSKVNQKYVALVFAVKIYDEQGRGISFKDIDNEYIRLLDRHGNEIVRYDLDSDHSFDEKNCGVFWILRRVGHSWRLEPMAHAEMEDDFDDALLKIIEKKF